MPGKPEKSTHVEYGSRHTLGAMHEHVGLPSQPFGTLTQCDPPLASPPAVSMDTQVWSLPVQSVQMLTLSHCVESTHGPQQPPTTLGNLPGSHSGGSALQNTSVGLHAMPATQRPAVQVRVWVETPSIEHMLCLHAAGHGVGVGSPGPYAAHVQQSSKILH